MTKTCILTDDQLKIIGNAVACGQMYASMYGEDSSDFRAAAKILNSIKLS